MAKVVWTNAAERDLDAILAYCLDEAGPDVAQAVFTRMREQVGSLCVLLHRCRPGRVSGTREYVLHRLPYIAVVQIVEGSVAVLGLAHTARKYP